MQAENDSSSDSSSDESVVQMPLDQGQPAEPHCTSSSGSDSEGPQEPEPPRPQQPTVVMAPQPALHEALPEPTSDLAFPPLPPSKQKDEAHDSKAGGTLRRHRQTDYQKFMQSKLRDPDFAAGAGHKDRFKLAVQAWADTKPPGAPASKRATAATYADTPPPRKKAKPSGKSSSKSAEPSAPKTLAVASQVPARDGFGCSKCRHHKDGCLLCNPEKATRAKARKQAREKQSDSKANQ